MIGVEDVRFIDHPLIPSSFEEGCWGGGLSVKNACPPIIKKVYLWQE